jgi:hypothetical protein
MGIKINMEKARDIWRDKIRIARAPLWEDLDAEWYKAMEEGRETTNIVAKKKALRDLPQHESIINAESVEELQEIWNTELLGDK